MMQPPNIIGLYPGGCCWTGHGSYVLPVRFAYLPGRWVVFRYEDDGGRRSVDEVVEAHRHLLERRPRRERRDGLPFLLGPDGRADARINGFFTSPGMRARSPLTWRKYAYALGLWLNFLLAVDRRWDAVTEEDAEYFKEWRLTDLENPRPVETSTFAGDLAAGCGAGSAVWIQSGSATGAFGHRRTSVKKRRGSRAPLSGGAFLQRPAAPIPDTVRRCAHPEGHHLHDRHAAHGSD